MLEPRTRKAEKGGGVMVWTAARGWCSAFARAVVAPLREWNSKQLRAIRPEQAEQAGGDCSIVGRSLASESQRPSWPPCLPDKVIRAIAVPVLFFCPAGRCRSVHHGLSMLAGPSPLPRIAIGKPTGSAVHQAGSSCPCVVRGKAARMTRYNRSPVSNACPKVAHA